MKMISYWNVETEIHVDDGLTLFIGEYDHKNLNKPYKALGVHWGDYPQSRGILSPCVIPQNTRNAILSGLLHEAVSAGNTEQISKLTQAIEYFR